MARTIAKKIVPSSRAHLPAVVYRRVSTKEQAEGGSSLEAQESRLLAYCTGVRGLVVLENVADAGVSGSVPFGERPGGARVLDLVRSGTVGHVVATKLDRAFRDAGDCLNVSRDLDNLGVSLHLLDLNMDTSTPMGRAFLTVFAAFAEMEKSIAVERVRETMRDMRARGIPMGCAPWGKKWVRRGTGEKCDLVDCPEELEVRDWARKLASGGKSLRAIAAELSANGILGRRGKPLSHEQIRRMLAPETSGAPNNPAP